MEVATFVISLQEQRWPSLKQEGKSVSRHDPHRRLTGKGSEYEFVTLSSIPPTAGQ